MSCPSLSLLILIILTIFGEALHHAVFSSHSPLSLAWEIEEGTKMWNGKVKEDRKAEGSDESITFCFERLQVLTCWVYGKTKGQTHDPMGGGLLLGTLSVTFQSERTRADQEVETRTTFRKLTGKVWRSVRQSFSCAVLCLIFFFLFVYTQNGCFEGRTEVQELHLPFNYPSVSSGNICVSHFRDPSSCVCVLCLMSDFFYCLLRL
jgi:hypothetical protein